MHRTAAVRDGRVKYLFGLDAPVQEMLGHERQLDLEIGLDVVLWNKELHSQEAWSR